MHKMVSTLFFSAMILLLAACDGKEKQDVSYSHDIQPIFNKYCIACHSSGGSANLDLSGYEGLMSGENDNPPALIAGYPEESLLYNKIAYDPPGLGNHMPPTGSLQMTSEDIMLIETWILQGAKNN